MPQCHYSSAVQLHTGTIVGPLKDSEGSAWGIFKVVVLLWCSFFCCCGSCCSLNYFELFHFIGLAVVIAPMVVIKCGTDTEYSMSVAVVSFDGLIINAVVEKKVNVSLRGLEGGYCDGGCGDGGCRNDV